MQKLATLPINSVHLSHKGRSVDDDSVSNLMDSLKAIGLRTPITVRACKKVVNLQQIDAYEVVSGQHRLRAAQRLGWQTIDCFITSDDETACRMWEISENLHRAELPQLERDKLVAEWCVLVGKPVSAQVAPKPQGGRPEGGVREASRQLGLDRDDVRRAVKVASLSPEAQEAAHKAGLADNRTALLEAAKLPTGEQAAYLKARAERKPIKLAPEAMTDFEAEEKQYAALILAWNKAGQEARQRFMREVGI